MLKNLKFSQRILLMPTVAGLCLILIVLATLRTVSRNEHLSSLIESGYYPASELNRDLEEILAGVQRGLQAAVASREGELLVETDDLRDAFLARLDTAADNPTLDPERVADLRRRFEGYYTLARQASERMMSDETGLGIGSTIESMAREYTAIRDSLEASTARAQ